VKAKWYRIDFQKRRLPGGVAKPDDGPTFFYRRVPECQEEPGDRGQCEDGEASSHKHGDQVTAIELITSSEGTRASRLAEIGTFASRPKSRAKDRSSPGKYCGVEQRRSKRMEPRRDIWNDAK